MEKDGHIINDTNDLDMETDETETYNNIIEIEGVNDFA